MKNIYSVTGMTCGACVKRVEIALAPFAESVEVTLNPPQVMLINATADLASINTALNKAGHYALKILEKPLDQLNYVADKTAEKNAESNELITWLNTYKPLLLIFAYILLVILAVENTLGGFSLHRLMTNFMAGFFLVFSFFKLLDLKGFANSYAMYDVLAKRLPIYGYVYPFIELALGTAYLLAYRPVLVNSITLMMMAFSSIGVILAVLNKQKIRCACLGTGFNLPMTTVTIIEDLLMAAMAAWMVF